MNTSAWLWAILAAAVGVDLLSAAAKFAFTHVRMSTLITMRESDAEDADRTVALLDKMGLRTSLRLALSLSHFLIAVAAILILTNLFGLTNPAWLLLSVTGLMLVISAFEYLIERSILDSPERSAVRWTEVARVLNFIFWPASHLMLALLGEHAEKASLSVTDEALRDWVEQGQPEGTLEKGERQMIYSIFRFGDTLAREIMVPRIDLLALDINTTISEARREFISAGHSRVPVYDDNIDNVVGLLYAKDLLAVVDGTDTIANQRGLLRPAYFVPEAKKIDELLTEMQSRGIHMALVVDEYGGVSGVVTLEDIVEEIVGEIRDEYDQGEEQLYEKTGENEYNFLGRTTIEEFNEITGRHLSNEFADTLGGFIYGELGHVPQPGEMVEAGGDEFIADQVVARRILKVKVHLQDTEHIETESGQTDADK